MFAFAAVYMQHGGFSTSTIGIVLGCSYALSAALQPTFAYLFRRLKIDAENVIVIIYINNILLAAALLTEVLPKAFIGFILIMMFGMQSALQPFIDILPRRWSNMGYPVNYGSARGIGSLLYAMMTMGIGYLLNTISPAILPAFYMVTIGLSLFLLFRLRIEIGARSENADLSGTAKSRKLWRSGMLPLLCGICCLSFGHVLIDNYMLLIMQSIGGGSENLGIAIGIASLVEFPAMLLYSRFSKRFGCYKLLILSAWAWLTKNILVLFSHTPTVIYAAELLQFCSYGIYIPSIVQFIASIYDMDSNIRGQSLAGSAYTAGGVISTLAGGLMLDAVGVRETLIIVVSITFAGALLISISVARFQRSLSHAH